MSDHFRVNYPKVSKLTAVVDFVTENWIDRNGKPAVLVHQESLEAETDYREIHRLGDLLGLLSNLLHFICEERKA